MKGAYLYTCDNDFELILCSVKVTMMYNVLPFLVSELVFKICGRVLLVVACEDFPWRIFSSVSFPNYTDETMVT